MPEFLVNNVWYFVGIFVAVTFIYGIVSSVKGTNELWSLLSQQFGISTSDWPDEFPNESASCTLAALEEEIIGWIFVRESGLMFRLPRLRKEDNALMFPWADVVGFRIEPDDKSATFAVDRKAGPRIEIRISWEEKLSRLAGRFRAESSI